MDRQDFISLGLGYLGILICFIEAVNDFYVTSIMKTWLNSIMFIPE